MPDGSTGGEGRRRGGRQGLAPGRGSPAVARRGPGAGSGRRPCPRPASGPGPSGGRAQSRRRLGRSGQCGRGGLGRSDHLGRQATSVQRPPRPGSRPGTGRRSGTAATPPSAKTGPARRSGRLAFVAQRGSRLRWPGRRGRPWRPRRHQPRSPTMSGRPRSSRWRSSRPGRAGGPARCRGQAWSGRQAWSSGPRAPDLLLRPPCWTRPWGRGKRHPAGSSRGRGPAIRRNVGRSRTHTPRPAAPATANRAPAEPPWATPGPPAPGAPGFRERGGSCGAVGAGQVSKCRRCRRCRPRQILFWLRRTLSRLQPIPSRLRPILPRRGTDPAPAVADPVLGTAASLARLDAAAGPPLRRGRIRRRPHLPSGPRSVGQQRGTRSHRSACQQGRLRGLRRGPGRMWRGGWPRLPRRRLLRLRPPHLRHASPGPPDSSSAWTRPG